MRYLLPILALILFFLYSWNKVSDKKTACCNIEGTSAATSDSRTAEKVASTAAVTTGRIIGPLVFNSSNEDAITDRRFTAYRDSILRGLKDGQLLQITGAYYADETNNSTFENLGLARANKTKELFSGQLADERIRVNSQLGTRDRGSDPFDAATFRYLTDNAAVKEIDNQALIYFNFATNQKIRDPRIDSYLNDVADRVKKSGERIKLTGHTDNKGDDGSNQRLGQRRAEAIKQILVGKGVASGKILTSSKGESEPVATNNTDSGRQKNRRTVLEIIQ